MIETGPKGKKSKDGPTSTAAAPQPQAVEGAAAFAATEKATVVAAPILTDNPLDPLGEVPAVPEGAGPLGSEENLPGGIESRKNTVTASRVASGGHTGAQGTAASEHPPEALNKKALDIIHR